MTILKPLSPEAIGQEYKKELSVQDYSKKTVIDGVQIINLPMFYDDGGSLAEIVRLTTMAVCRFCLSSKSSKPLTHKCYLAQSKLFTCTTTKKTFGS
jgi:hypothetical protein